MSEQFDDVELSRALKKGAAESLAGWEFTPAMRARVMEQIRAEETGVAAPAQRPVRRLNPIQAMRPLALVAVAAAAVFFVVRVGLPPVGNMKAADGTTATAPAESKPQAPVQESAAKTAVVPGSDTKQLATAPAAEAPAVASAPTPDMRTETGSSRSVAVVDFTLPPTQDQGPASFKAAAPPAGKMGIAAVMAQNVALGGRGTALAGLNSDTVQGFDENGVPTWTVPSGGASNLAVSREGQVAVAAGEQIQILNTRGEAERQYTATAAVNRMVWSADNRVASGEGNLVFVYGGTGKAEFFVEAGLNADMAFAPDGNLAVYGDRQDDPGRLTVTDRKGAILWEARPKTGGRGLVWAGGGTVVVAGGKAYDGSGKALWEAPIKTDGVAALGDSAVVVWNAQTVLVLDARSGQVLVQGNYTAGGVGVHRVVTGEKHAAVLSDLGDGTAGLWVIDEAGHVALAETLPEQPVDLTFGTSDRLVLMFPQSVTVKEVP